MKSVELTSDSNHADVDMWRGFSIRESAGSPAAATVLFKKASSGGELVGVLELQANESATLIISKRKINVEGGLYVDVTSGTISGVLYYD